MDRVIYEFLELVNYQLAQKLLLHLELFGRAYMSETCFSLSNSRRVILSNLNWGNLGHKLQINQQAAYMHGFFCCTNGSIYFGFARACSCRRAEDGLPRNRATIKDDYVAHSRNGAMNPSRNHFLQKLACEFQRPGILSSCIDPMKIWTSAISTNMWHQVNELQILTPLNCMKHAEVQQQSAKPKFRLRGLDHTD